MRDFEAYYAAGAAWRAGEDPYGAAIWRYEKVLAGVQPARYELLPFVGPPAILPLWSAVARLPFAAANLAWRALLVPCVAALVLVALGLCRIRIAPFSFAAVAVAALGFGPITSAVALGQIALPSFACAALALLWAPAGIFAWAQPNIALTLASQVPRRAGAIAFVAGIAAFASACLIVAGPQGCLRYLAVLRAHELAERFALIQITPAAVAYGFGASPAAAATVGIAVSACAIALWVLFMLKLRDSAARFCATCALVPAAMPFFHEHDLLIAFLPALYFTMRCSARVWPLAAGGALLCATDWLGLAQRPDGMPQTLLLVGAAGIALFALRNDLHARALAAPAAVLALVGIAGAFAYAHPAPVWPDAMRALPATVLHGNAAQVWSAEQIAAGLLARNPFCAILRCGSLGGCALLALAACLRRPDRGDQMSTFIISSNCVTAPG